MKLVHKAHHRDQQNVVLIHRWSLYASSASCTIMIKEYLTQQLVLICIAGFGTGGGLGGGLGGAGTGFGTGLSTLGTGSTLGTQGLY